MLTLRDCIDLADLTEEEIDAIAEYAHVPEIIAVEMGQYLVHRPDGKTAVSAIIRDDIAEAERRGDHERAKRLRLVLRHFIARCKSGHIECIEMGPGWLSPDKDKAKP